MSTTFRILLRQLVVPASTGENELSARAAKRLGIPAEDVLALQVVRRSLDARKRRGKAVNVYHLRLELPNSWRGLIRKSSHLDVVIEKPGKNLPLNLTDPSPSTSAPRPVVVGAGPAGLFAALRLARAGWKPILLERGEALAERRRKAAMFWRDGALDPESNVLFGLGGAGLFSDGKLNTRHKDREGITAVLANMVEAGAPESILVDATPHVGSDLLGEVVTAIAGEVERWGGEIRYRTRLADLRMEQGSLREVVVVHEGTTYDIRTDHCILAAGHSARDLYEMLDRHGIAIEAKPFAVGVRVEMPQEAIDRSQRNGPFRPAPGQAAAFRLSRPPEGDAGACYTFCMCPGGLVIACASEPGRLAVNGMSFHARAGEWGNAAFLTPVGPDDFSSFEDVPPPLRGLALQRHWEEKAWLAGRGAGDYAVPASSLADFVAGRSGQLPVRRGVARAASADVNELLPPQVATTLRVSIPRMIERMRYVRPEDVLLYAIESRTSSPVRVPRNVDGCMVGCCGVFPAGEGSGYAGGITTSALDGWKVAGRVMQEAKRS